MAEQYGLNHMGENDDNEDEDDDDNDHQPALEAQPRPKLNRTTLEEG
jgi:hypothetical protein